MSILSNFISTIQIIWSNILLLKDFILEDHVIRYRTTNDKELIIGSYNSTGLDIQLPKTIIPPKSCVKIPLGFYIDYCPKYVKPSVVTRSSTNQIYQLDIPIGTADSDYRGEYMLVVRNVSDTEYIIEENCRLCQIVFEVILPQCLARCTSGNVNVINRVRGTEGFGSSNKYL